MGLISLPDDIDPRANLNFVERLLCEKSLARFIEQAWHIVEPGADYVHNWHIDFIAAHLEAIARGEDVDGELYRQLLINVPPGMMKSLEVSVFWPAWIWGPLNKPHVRLLTVSHNVDLSIRDNLKMRRLILSGWYQKRWGDRVKLTADQSAKTKFENTATGFRQASASGSITGNRADIVICFPAGQMVATDQGMEEISDLVRNGRGRRIWSLNEGTGSCELKPIIKTFSNPGKPLVRVSTETGEVICTLDHKVRTESRGFVVASSLIVGERLAALPSRVFISSSPVRRQEVKVEMSPCAARSDASNRWGAYTKFLREFCCGLRVSSGDLAHKFLSKMRSAISKVAISFAIGKVVGSRAIFDIFKPVIRRDIVFVPNLASQGALSKESCRHHPMDESIYSLFVDVQRDARISLTEDGSHHLSWDAKNVSLADYLMREASNASEVRDLIEARSFNDIKPDFVRVISVDHLDDIPSATYCVTVEGNHTLCVGELQPIICSNCDDPHSVESAGSDQQRETTKEWFLEALPSRLNKPKESAIVCIMQRLHEEDVSGLILEYKGSGLPGWDHICLPMRFDPRRKCETKLGYEDPRTEDGELLFPERFPESVVDALEHTMGPYATAGQHNQSPVPRGGGLIKDDWWTLWTEAEYPPLDYVVGYIDTAYGEKQDGDYCAMTVWGIFTIASKAMITGALTRDGTVQKIERTYAEGAPNVVLMHAWNKRLTFPELIELVIATGKKWKLDRLLVENKTAGPSLVQELRKSLSTEEYGLTLDNITGDKWSRLSAVQHLFSEGMIWAPDKAWSEMVIRQVGTFPRGKHDDIVDTVSGALGWLRRNGLLTRAPERLFEIEESKIYHGRAPIPLYPS